jgi:hypothetical protein
MSDVISEIVCGWSDLVHLETCVLDTQALAHLASLPSLKSLHFRSSDFGRNIPPNSISTFTSNLDQVCIAAPSPSHLTRCLRNARFLSCRSVVLSIGLPDTVLPYHPDISDLIASFSECFSPTLEKLYVEIFFDYGTLDEDTLDAQRVAFGFDAIAPLMSFSRLTKLDLDWFCTSDVDDDALKKMLQSWPNLEEFYFGISTAPLVPPSITFIGFVYLIQHCRHLRDIQMSFRACSIAIDREPFSTTTPNKNITLLEVGDSPIVDPIAVAGQLYSLLPNLPEVSHGFWENNWEDVPPSIVDFNEEWDKVNEYLQVLTKSAEIREKRGESLEGCQCSFTA